MKKIKALTFAVMAIVMSLFSTVTALADPAIFDTAEVMSTAMTSLVAEIMGVVAVVVPIAMVLVGSIIAIRFGIRFIRGLVGR